MYMCDEAAGSSAVLFVETAAVGDSLSCSIIMSCCVLVDGKLVTFICVRRSTRNSTRGILNL